MQRIEGNQNKTFVLEELEKEMKNLYKNLVDEETLEKDIFEGFVSNDSSIPNRFPLRIIIGAIPSKYNDNSSSYVYYNMQSHVFKVMHENSK